MLDGFSPTIRLTATPTGRTKGLPSGPGWEYRLVNGRVVEGRPSSRRDWRRHAENKSGSQDNVKNLDPEARWARNVDSPGSDGGRGERQGGGPWRRRPAPERPPWLPRPR
jgi:hypothetical protein